MVQKPVVVPIVAAKGRSMAPTTRRRLSPAAITSGSCFFRGMADIPRSWPASTS